MNTPAKLNLFYEITRMFTRREEFFLAYASFALLSPKSLLLLGMAFLSVFMPMTVVFAQQKQLLQAQVQEVSVLWRGDMEEGHMGDWWLPSPVREEGNNCGGEYNSNGGSSNASTNVAHSGRYSARLYQGNSARGTDVGVRLFRWCESQQQAIGSGLYYSSWYYLPARITVTDWYSIMQWKSAGSHNAKVHMAVQNQPDGSMGLSLCQGRDSGGRCWHTTATIPVRTWFHLEAYYVKSTTRAGRVIFWLNGQQIADAAGVDTANSSDLAWSVISYGTQVLPNNNTIYVDDAAISTVRLGPGYW